MRARMDVEKPPGLLVANTFKKMQFVAWEKMVKIFFLKNFITFFWEVIFIHRFHRVLDSLFSFLSNLFLSSSLVVHVRNVIDSPYSYWSFLLSHLGVYTKKND